MTRRPRARVCGLHRRVLGVCSGFTVQASIARCGGFISYSYTCLTKKQTFCRAVTCSSLDCMVNQVVVCVDLRPQARRTLDGVHVSMISTSLIIFARVYIGRYTAYILCIENNYFACLNYSTMQVQT